jgi:hypothetical protein
MKYRLTFLNTPALLFIMACIFYTAARYDELSKKGGCGVTAMIGLTVYGIIALIADGKGSGN